MPKHTASTTLRRLALTAAATALTALSSAAAADAYFVTAGGARGAVSDNQTATCKATTNGTLNVSSVAPAVTGVNLRSGYTDTTYARYAVWLVGPSRNTVQVSNWSNWMTVRDTAYSRWSGVTTLGAWWRNGPYRTEIRVEWWNSSRRLGFHAYGLDAYNHITAYGVANGRHSSCGLT